MPPTVREVEQMGLNTPSFSIDLDGPEDFNPDLFDRQFQQIDEASTLTGTSNAAKFIVVGSRMVIFPLDRNHSDMHFDMSRGETDKAGAYSGELLCAGTVVFDPDTGQREVTGNSDTLKSKGLLDKNASDDYKNSVLKEKLGEYFEFS